ncbi:MAG: ATP F0F1 synthase subunit B [Albidovulum sp.]|nr:ATP F0F1 synthase subunit B [Albidovulum sp.]MDE0534526.1 ATP F0F1 synthase subunit B [Albidovulum sp.]
MNRSAVSTAALCGTVAIPAYAASGPFLSLYNTNFVVLISFVLFIGVLLYFKVPKFVAALLDRQIESIRSKLAETASIREDAKSLLDRCQREREAAGATAELIVSNATEHAASLVEKAKVDIKGASARRIAAAEEQIAIAEEAAIAEIRNRAAEIAVSAAGQIIASKLDADDRNRLFDQAVKDTETHLN